MKNRGYIGFTRTQIVRVPDQQGKSIEEEIRTAITSKQPLDGDAPELYTAKKDGVLPQYDIRTDRQELAIELTDKYAKSDMVKNDENPETQGKGSENEKESETNVDNN